VYILRHGFDSHSIDWWHVAKSYLTTRVGGPIGRWKMGLHMPMIGVCVKSPKLMGCGRSLSAIPSVLNSIKIINYFFICCIMLKYSYFPVLLCFAKLRHTA
jgi:hypothetical protein